MAGCCKLQVTCNGYAPLCTVIKAPPPLSVRMSPSVSSPLSNIPCLWLSHYSNCHRHPRHIWPIRHQPIRGEGESWECEHCVQWVRIQSLNLANLSTAHSLTKISISEIGTISISRASQVHGSTVCTFILWAWNLKAPRSNLIPVVCDTC